MRVDDRELRARLAPKQIGRAGGRLVEQLAKVHAKDGTLAVAFPTRQDRASLTFQNGISQVFDPLRLRLLVEVDRRGSIAAAADACGVGQPSATKHLQTLASAVGQPLLRRTGRGSQLTDAGHVVSEHAARMLGTLGAMEDELRALHVGDIGSLSIAASTSPGAYVLPSVLKCFAERHPGVDVTVAIGPSHRVVAQVARREVQLGLAGETVAAPGTVTEPFLDDELVGIAAPDAHIPDRITVAELASHTLLVREPGSSTRATAERYLARVGYTPPKVWKLDSNEAIKRAVTAGLGIAFLSRLVVQDELGRGELAEFAVADVPPMSRPVQLITADDGQLTPAQRAFIATLTDCCASNVSTCVVQRPV
ncbi:MAG: LysR family transcriptional regulator [Solirubrobacterales bacterium]|nr:LysR family transcriptional regulator [Solirubrobacterales bacterium]